MQAFSKLIQQGNINFDFTWDTMPVLFLFRDYYLIKGFISNP
jgi:hypothetical protein